MNIATAYTDEAAKTTTTGTLPLVSLKSVHILLPGEEVFLPDNVPDQEVITEGFQNNTWPPPHITQVQEGKLKIKNTASYLVTLDQKVKNPSNLLLYKNSLWLKSEP